LLTRFGQKNIGTTPILINYCRKEFFSQGYIAGKSDGTIETVRECADFLADTLDDHFASEQLREQFGVEE